MNMEPKRYLTVEEAGDYLGISRWSIYKMVDRRLLPFIPISAEDNPGKPLLRFDRLALDGWMTAKTIKPLKKDDEE